MPVILHAFRARRLLLIRDLILSAILGLGLFALPGVTIAWALAAYTVRLAIQDHKLPRRDRRRPASCGDAFFVAVIIALCSSGFSPLALLLGAGAAATDNSQDSFERPASPGIPSGFDALVMGAASTIFVLVPVILTTATLAVIVFARITLFPYSAQIPGPQQGSDS